MPGKPVERAPAASAPQGVGSSQLSLGLCILVDVAGSRVVFFLGGGGRQALQQNYLNYVHSLRNMLLHRAYGKGSAGQGIPA